MLFDLLFDLGQVSWGLLKVVSLRRSLVVG